MKVGNKGLRDKMHEEKIKCEGGEGKNTGRNERHKI